MDSMLYCIALLMSKRRIEINARVRPHPGQDISNRDLIGQRGKDKNLVIINKTQNTTSPTIKECRACFFRFDAFLYLCQGLTIAVAESAGQDRDQVYNSSNQTYSEREKVKNAASCFSYVHSVESCKTKKSKDTENESNHFALSRR